MSVNAYVQIVAYLLILVLLVWPIGWYIAGVFSGKSFYFLKIFKPIETLLYRVCGVDSEHGMDWKEYLYAFLVFNILGCLVLYIITRIQAYLPLNPQAMHGMSADLAFNTSVSFSTNTNWQSYSGETTLSYFTQMFGLTVQNFLSAASGMSVLVAFIRGIASRENTILGNFWVDTIRGILYVLIPMSFIAAIILVSQGVVQNFLPNQKVALLQPYTYEQVTTVDGVISNVKTTITEQVIPMGPVASQVAIRQLGSNGGGFFNVNAAHPFENPNSISNFLEILMILLVPAAFCFTYGTMVNDKSQGVAILASMLILLVPFTFMNVISEQTGNPALTQMGIDPKPQPTLYSGGNMEGKETRFGIVNSASWAAFTTAAANGSVNSMHDSYMPLGGGIPMWMMQLSEVVFGGVGSGLYGMLILVIVTVFLAGLMVGRTPEYLGKKIEPYEMVMSAIAVLIMPFIVLVFTAFGVGTHAGTSSIANPGAHGFSEILYAFTSMGNNNGSAFAGLNANTPFYNILGGIAMLVERYGIAFPVLGIAGSLAKKKIIPKGLGTLETHTTLFVLLLVMVTILMGLLVFLPAFALGPIVEHLILWEQYGS